MRLRSRSAGWANAILLAAAVGRCWGQVDVKAWPKVKMTVQVLDANGDPLQVAVDDLVVKEAGHAVKVESLTRANQPQSVCLMIDASGSMYDRMDKVKSIAGRLIRSLPAEDEVCVADFSRETFVDTELTEDRAAALKGLGVIKASGGTAIYDALVRMSELMRRKARYPDRAIILLSDGADNASKMSEGAMREAMAASGSAVVHVFSIPSPGHTDRREEASDEKAALMLARIGGGLAYFPRSADDLAQAADSLVAAMKVRYQMTFTTADESRGGRERRLDVELDKVHQKQKAVVRAPEGYYAPSY